MNEINTESSIIGGSVKIQIKNIPDKISRQEILNAIEFYIERIPFKRKPNFTLKVDFIKYLYRNEKFIAFAWPYDKKEKLHLIQIDPKLNKWKILESICHELVHIKQFRNKELSEEVKENNTCLWKGRRYPDGSKDDDEYYTRLWEFEAYGMEACLSRLFKIHLKKQGKF